jgi:uncharacterized protein (DUF1501 family)
MLAEKTGSSIPASHNSRRRFLKTGSMVSMALGLGELLRLRDVAAATSQRDTSVILVWLPGGLSHIDTYDMKPDAPAEYRGEFRPIRTVVPGINICEELPLHARVADRFNLIRSVSHGFGTHSGAHKEMMTGNVPKSKKGFVNEVPSVGSVVARLRESQRLSVPVYTSGQREGTDADSYSQGAAWLGHACMPFLVPGDPSDDDWSIPNLSVVPEVKPRMLERRALLKQFDQIRRDLDQHGVVESSDRFNQQAFEILTSNAARNAFDLSREDPAVRDRYGRNPYGQQALLARRLVEAGTGFANVVMEHPGGQKLSSSAQSNWDCHAVNCHVFNDSRWRFPNLDRAVSALIEDIYQRGLDRRVMLIVMGEFGHTPRISYEIGSQTQVMQPGRDHWPGAMSILVSGGGMRTGQIIGSTNELGEHPVDRPLSPSDLWATAYRHLGIDPNHTFLDHFGRPRPILPDGEPIAELI